MLKKLSRNCHDFILHCQQSSAVTKEDKESCFDIFLTITSFLADVVQILRQADDDFSELTYARGENSTLKKRIFVAKFCDLLIARQVGVSSHGRN